DPARPALIQFDPEHGLDVAQAAGGNRLGDVQFGGRTDDAALPGERVDQHEMADLEPAVEESGHAHRSLRGDVAAQHPGAGGGVLIGIDRWPSGGSSDAGGSAHARSSTVTSRSPVSTEATGVIAVRVTVPATGVVIAASIFIASIVASVVPA